MFWGNDNTQDLDGGYELAIHVERIVEPGVENETLRNVTNSAFIKFSTQP
jgi:hypothetical protein